MRTLAAEHLKESCGYMVDMAKKLAHSCVSQRDIQVSKGCLPILCSLFASVLFISGLLVHQLIVLVVF